MNKIPVGEINNKELLEHFGTKKQIESYIKDKRLGGNAKKRILTKAKKFCDIEDLGKGKYIIHKTYNIPQDDPILPLKKGLYQYLTPLVLSKLLDDDEQFKTTLPFLGWARKFDMINDNYSLLKYNQEQGSVALNINPDIMFEYFDKIDDCIKYYLQECLSILSDPKGLNLIDFDSIKMVKKAYVTPVNKDDGGVEVICKYEDEVVSDDDRKFIYECEAIAKEKAGITNNREKFYGVKSYIYKRELKSLLSKRNILFMYSAYNIYCKDSKELTKALEKFQTNISNRDEFIKVFNKYFADYLERTAQNRQNREIQKKNEVTADNIKYIKEYRLIEEYLKDYRGLLDATMFKDTPVLDIVNENDIHTILTEFNISVKKV